MSRLTLFLFHLCVILHCSWTNAVKFEFQISDYKNEKGSLIRVPFCLRKDSYVNIKPSLDNIVDLKVDGEIFPKSGNKISRGRHLISMPSAVKNGVINVDVEDNQLTDAQIHCEVFCAAEIPKHDVKPVETIPCGKIVQRSKPGNCAEEKNVFIDFYHEKLKKFRITATHPAYRSLLNARLDDRKNCFNLTETIWEFTHEDVTHLFSEKNDAILEVGELPGQCFLYDVSFNFTKLLHDVDIPGINGALVVTIPKQKTAMEVVMKVVNKKVAVKKEIIQPGQTTLEIPYPEKTWSRFGNKIEVKMCGEGSRYVTSIQLTRRNLTREQGQVIFDNGEIIVEKVRHDVWWLGDPGMEITINTTQVTDNTHYIRVYSRVPWGGYSQNFVIYQDGVIRLLPPTTHGADWIPFGTFLLSGRFDPTAERFSSKIDKITIDPETTELRVHYSDGSIWNYKINVGFDKTEVDVEIESAPKELSALPFLQLRSMFIEDGKSNVDRVSVDGLPEHGITEEWKELYGSSFFFYRGCISEYHTQSPDTHVQILE